MGKKANKGTPLIGFHAPIAGGLQNALLKARSLDCDTVQIFSRNPRGWMARPLTDEEVERFRAVRAETKISPVVALKIKKTVVKSALGKFDGVILDEMDAAIPKSQSGEVWTEANISIGLKN